MDSAEVGQPNVKRPGERLTLPAYKDDDKRAQKIADAIDLFREDVRPMVRRRRGFASCRDADEHPHAQGEARNIVS